MQKEMSSKIELYFSRTSNAMWQLKSLFKIDLNASDMNGFSQIGQLIFSSDKVKKLPNLKGFCRELDYIYIFRADLSDVPN